MYKPTLTTLKSFIKKNKTNLYIKVLSNFDGMTDCVQDVKDNFRKVHADTIDFTANNSYGIGGCWVVRQGRDLITNFSKNGFNGYEIYNCCGAFILATK